MNYDELKKVAEAAQVFCNKCGYMGDSEPTHKIPFVGKECGYSARKVMFCSPVEILALLAEREKLLKVAVAAKDVVGSTEYCRSLRSALKELDK